MCRPLTKLVPDCMARRSVASLGLDPAAAVGGTITAGMGEGLRRTGGAGRVRILALSSAPCLKKKNVTRSGQATRLPTAWWYYYCLGAVSSGALTI